ncbi:hypothetical protein [[Clostridium] polysaccharolyticum]|uniref:Uncharacterized protein n=1 Tax=[Clostridium] polysaccharolyticum TaxID=29364 RepID=A0A1H9ZBC7_9FIRM|nr:hypothetical protein [[Clostridium] polysaccharolyticum]SES78835.1 hypothetical protein SAMN04487772_103110 [[Clostridium] polysaccharolyticum]
MDELYIKFIVIGLLKCKSERSWLQKVWMKLKRHITDIQNKMRLVYSKEEIEVLGKRGVLIELPFVEEEAAELPKDYLEEYIRRILEVYDIPSCYLRRELHFLNDRFQMDKKWIFQYLLFDKGLHMFLDKYSVSIKNARFVIIDSGNKKVETILQILLEYANYLTIVTNREKYFQNAVEVVYEETGLMIEVASSLTQKNIIGNVIINLDRECYRLYSNFEQDAYVMDLEFTDKKFEYLSNRRKDLKILYDYDITAEHQQIEKELVAEIITRDNWKLSRFAGRKESSLARSEIEKIVDYYKLEIDKLCTIS